MNKTVVKTLIPNFLKFFIPLVIFILTTLYFDLSNKIETVTVKQTTTAKHLLFLSSEYIQESINNAKLDLFTLSDRPYYEHIFKEDNDIKKLVQQDLLAFMRQKKLYQEIYVLDAKGNGIIHVNYVDGNASLFPATFLQNKSNYDFFKQTMALEKGDYYISSLDYHKHLENAKPFSIINPSIHLATPIFDTHHQKIGMIILTYSAKQMLENIGYIISEEKLKLYIIDKDRYYLIDEKSPLKPQSLASEAQSPKKIFSTAYHTIMQHSYGVYKEKDKYFFYQTIPIKNQHWHILSYLELNHTPAVIFKRNSHIFISVIFFLFVSAFVIWGYVYLKALQEETEGKLSDFSKTTAEWLWETDEDLYFKEISPKIKEIANIDPKNYLDEHFNTLLHPLDYHTLDMLQERQILKKALFKIENPLGQILEFAVSAKPYYRNGIFQGYRGAAHDITNYKHLNSELQFRVKAAEEAHAEAQMLSSQLEQGNKALREAKEKAELATKSKSIFLANMSHEIRTPLNAINGLLSLLKEDERNPQRIQYFNTIEKATETLLSTINDILDFSKIESGKLKINNTDFNFYEELNSSIDIFRHKAAEKSIDIDVYFADGIPKILFGDILRIRQVVNNLLSNAIKFSSENGLIWIECNYCRGMLHIYVKDNGIGISQKEQKRIFNSFEQEDNSIVKEYGGTGLGLSISQEIVKMMGGKLRLNSTKGKGSLFYFSIPIQIGSEILPKEETLDMNKPLHGHVLIVEDMETSQVFMTLLMKRYNLSYTIANNGMEAVERFGKEHFDLIFMDENMPKLNGRAATQKIREIEKNNRLSPIPIVALTANAMAGDREKFIESGMNDYLSKPIEPQSLLKLLHRYLR